MPEAKIIPQMVIMGLVRFLGCWGLWWVQECEPIMRLWGLGPQRGPWVGSGGFAHELQWNLAITW